MKIIELKRNGDNMKTDIFGMISFQNEQKATQNEFWDMKQYIHSGTSLI